MSAPHSALTGEHGATFWAGVVVGAATIVFGAYGLVTHVRFGRVLNAAGFFAASGVAHDAVWAPLLVAGAVATRRLPRAMRRSVRVGLVASAGLVLFAAPVLHGYAGRRSNPSALPLDYRRNVAAILVVLWLLIAARVAVAAWKRPR